VRIVLLSGGSGKRLWPLSNEVRSKVFLKLLRSETGVMESMIQRICRELDKVGLLASSCIVTHESQTEITRSHIGCRIPILGEPQKRGTFTAVALAASYWHSVRNVGPEETVAVLPVDSYADPSFFQLLLKFPAVLAEASAEMALLGSVPKFPSAEFGYIVPQAVSSGNGYYTVDRFVEKPDPDTAERLIGHKALWNCGVFACSLSFLLGCLAERGIDPAYDKLLHSYERMPRESFDREVLEHTRRTVVMPYAGNWNDLGSWESLTNHLDNHVTGKGDVSPDSVHSHLVNELPQPVHVIGVPNIIVAASPDGILVADKSRANEIKHQLDGVSAKPLYEEKRWGTSRVLDYSLGEEGGVVRETVTRKVEIYAGKHTSVHLHYRTAELWTVISGTGEYRLDGEIHPLSVGDSLRISAGEEHAIRATTTLTLIQIESGGSPGEEDIMRISQGWGSDDAKFSNDVQFNEDN
jgi:mannose-1-phosphate guanylyltransferase